MVWLAQWQVKDNDEHEAIFKLEKTLNSFKKHLDTFAGDKLLYFEVTDIG